MVERDVRHAPPEVSSDASLAPGQVRPAARPYRTPTLTVYGTIRDLTRGAGIGPPDNGVSHSHSMSSPYAKKSK